jgi:superfamily II DNA or RNA helicase
MMTYEELFNENMRLRERVCELERENALLRAAQRAPSLSEAESTQYCSRNPQKLTAEQKESELQRRVALFRELFHGREDVYAQRFVSKSGKVGYQPVCKNRWSTGCHEQRYKCEGCPLREFVQLDDNLLRKHLDKNAKERDVIGIYPILEDNTVFFLCADFDDKNCEHGYKEDVLSYMHICKEWGIPAYIERSRSGNGAHVWIFFSEAVLAAKARKLGFAILSAAMENNVRLEMASYDRFFPNQDFLPKGGFGNLVALPLQGMARRSGNSVFVDESFTVYPNQWNLLSSVAKLSGDELSAMLEQHNLSLELSYSSESKPWETPKPDSISFEDFNGTINIVRANGIYVPIRSVSGKVIRHLKGLASFRNPKYYELLNARKPLYNTPSVVSCYEMTDDYLKLPRGCEDAVIELIQSNFSSWEESDQTNAGHPIDVRFTGQLRHEQEDAVQRMLAYSNGILAATTAFGKTVAAIGMIARKRINTLILVHSKALLKQWKSEIEKFLIINEPQPEEQKKEQCGRKTYNPIGLLDGTQNTLHGIIDIAVFNSAMSQDGVKPFVRDYGMVIVDECHHVAAIGYERVLKYINARHVYGLSATPYRQDGMTPIVFMQCGPIRFKSDAKEQIAHQSFNRVLIPRFTSFRALEEKTAIQYLRDLAVDKARNQLIIGDVVASLSEGRCPIILTKRKDHIDILAEMLKPYCRNIIRLIGTAPVKEKRQTIELLQEIPDSEPFIIIATGKYVGEGFNYPRLDTLFIALPVAYSNIVQQYTGRLHREFKGKKEVRVYDYIDIHVPVLANMYGKRLKSYAPIGYSQQVTEVLQSNPQNIVLGPDSFLSVLIEDIEVAKSLVVISCETVQYMQGRLAKAILALSVRNVACSIIIRKPSPRDDEFTKSGIILIQHSDQSIRSAVIDRSLLWFGNIDLAGSKHSEDDNVMRVFAPTIASEMLGYLLDKDLG